MTLIVIASPKRPKNYVPRHKSWWESNMRRYRRYRILKALHLAR